MGNLPKFPTLQIKYFYSPVKQASILFVDDEPITRRITTRLLRHEYETLEANSVQEALSILSDDCNNIGVVITDMRMPEEDGITLVRKITADYPHISIIATSGDLTKYDLPQLVKDKVIFAVLEKPWNREEAMLTVKAAMAAYLDKA